MEGGPVGLEVEEVEGGRAVVGLYVGQEFFESLLRCLSV